jgi:hypothetical protein
MYNSIRCKLRQELVDVCAQSPVMQAPSGWMAPMVLNPGTGAVGGYGIINPLLKVSMKTVIDQSCDGEVEALSVGELDRLRRNYRSIVGADPPREHNPTDNQLSGLFRRLEVGGAPFVDFCVFRKNGNRFERSLKFSVQVREVNGGTRNQEVPGPNCLESWEHTWSVFKAACLMLDVATGHTLDRYAAKIRELASEYPRAWHLLLQADLIMRSEEWVLEKRKQERAFGVAPQLSSYNAKMPWESVIREAAEMEQFWRQQFEKPANREEQRAMTGAPAFRRGAPEDWQQEDADFRPPKWERDYKPDKGKGYGGQGKDNDKIPYNEQTVRGDGRHMQSVNGTQICFEWARNEEGCKAQCPTSRAHICEWCRGDHRSIECPQHPGWVPDQKGGAKGDPKRRRM